MFFFVTCIIAYNLGNCILYPRIHEDTTLVLMVSKIVIWMEMDQINAQLWELYFIWRLINTKFGTAFLGEQLSHEEFNGYRRWSPRCFHCHYFSAFSLLYVLPQSTGWGLTLPTTATQNSHVSLCQSMCRTPATTLLLTLCFISCLVTTPLVRPHGSLYKMLRTYLLLVVQLMLWFSAMGGLVLHFGKLLICVSQA